MAELNFDILKPQPTAGASFVSGMMEGQQDARTARTQELQMQQSTRQGQIAELQLQKTQREEEALSKFYAHIAENGGPSDPIDIENKMIGSGIPQVANTGLTARMKRLSLEQERTRDYTAMFGTPPPSTVTPPAAPTATPTAAPTNALAPLSAAEPAPNNAMVPAVTTAIPSVAPPGETPLAAPINAMIPAVSTPPSVNNLDRDAKIRTARLKMLSKNPGVVSAGRIELQRLLNPTLHNVQGVGLVNADEPNKVIVASKAMPTPLANLIAEREAIAKANPNDPNLASYDANISKEINLEKGRQAQLKVSQGNLNVNQAGLNLRRSEADPFGINGGGGGVSMGAPAAPAVAAAAAPVLTVANAFKQNLHGDEFLAALPPAVRNEVNAIVTGNTPPPNQNSKRGQQLMQLVTQADPSFDATAYGVKFAGEKSFLAKQGPAVKSFNVLVSHFDTLDKAATALNNGDVKAFNSIGNTIAAQTGSTAPTDFAGVKKIVGDEIIKAIQGGAGALGDRKAIQDELSAANSPAQLASLINRFKDLAGGQLGGLAKQYESATGKTNFQDRFLLPEARKVFKTGSAAVGGGVDTSNPLLK